MDERGRLLRRGLGLEYVTIVYNIAEAILSIGAGIVAGSIALVAFGFDSTIEVAAATFVAVRLRAEMRDRAGDHARRDRMALRGVGVTFLVLGAYVAFESGRSLATGDRPETSLLGIAVAVASLLTMPILAVAKVRTARGLGSEALEADAKETFVCAYLSATLLAGLGLHVAFGWWWADPVGGLLMVPFVLYQGWDAMRHSGGHGSVA